MAAGFREGFVEADGFRVRYMEAGEGPPPPQRAPRQARELLLQCGRRWAGTAGDSQLRCAGIFGPFIGMSVIDGLCQRLAVVS